MISLSQFIFLLVTYAISAIPFGLVISTLCAKIDIRQVGSKNIGATNVTRVLGKKLGLLTLVLDGLKGAIMVIIARFTFSEIGNLHEFLAIVSAVAVVAHIFPIYLHFKGGKGVATAIATLFALDFSVGLLSACFWVMSFFMLRISSVASIVAVSSSIFLSIHYDAPSSQIILCWLLAILILVRHKENIVRLLTGEEKPIVTNKKTSSNAVS